MELPLFDQVGEIVRTMLPTDGDPVRIRAHRRGVKVWFGPVTAPRQHFEAQLIPAQLVGAPPDTTVIEIGWHSEDRDEAANDAALTGLGTDWAPDLGDAAVSGPFLGNDTWRRVSETWSAVDLDDPDAAFEIAARVVDYVDAIGSTSGEPGAD